MRPRLRPRFRLLGLLLGGPLAAGAADLPTPLLSDATIAVARIDLKRLDRAALGRLGLDPAAPAAPATERARVSDGNGLPNLIERLADRLKGAGATEAFLVWGVADPPGPPVVAVAAPGPDAARILDETREAARLAIVPRPDPVAARLVRGWAVAGSTAAVDRLDVTPPVARPDLQAALDEPVRRDWIAKAAIAPGPVLRRALGETLPELPAGLGGESIRPLIDGLAWGMVALSDAARPRLVVELQARDMAQPPGDPSAVARDQAAAAALVALLGRVQAAGVRTLRAEAATRDAAPTLEGLKFAVSSPPQPLGRITAEVDAQAVAPLLRAPGRLAYEERRRQEAIDQFKTLGLALGNYHAAHNTFPPAYSVDAAGRPLLSWRVLILPFLDEEVLYKEFHLDEPWDSPHNRALVRRMPKVYASPLQAPGLAAEWKTTTLAARGPNTTVRDGKGVPLSQVADGVGLTVVALQGADKDAATWTKPDDYAADARPDLGERRSLVLFGDGSALWLRPDVRPEVFRALLTTTGGETINPADLH